MDSTSEPIDYDNPPFPLTAIDREILATKDEDAAPITWSDLQQIIANNTLEQLKRKPSDLHAYLRWSHDIKFRYGGLTPYVIQQRLFWTPFLITSTPPTFSHHNSVPFADDRDYAILLNDWPYNFTPDIKHLLVWSKTPIAVDDKEGDVTDASRKVIEGLVERAFEREVGKENVLWFKNWVSLQSVRGVDHVHVLIRNAPPNLVERWAKRTDL